MNDLISLVQSRLKGIGKAIYLIRFGSALYGLSTGNSDEDYVCVYLPDASQLLMTGYEQAPASFNFTTKEDERAKNTSSDVDIRFLSLQRLLRGLAIPEISALDILYSFTNKDAIIQNNGFERVFAKRRELINLISAKPFVEYGLGQIKKYGLKGTSLGIAAAILDVLRTEDDIKNKKLGDIFESRIRPQLPKDHQFWQIEEIPQVGGKEEKLPALRLFEALHPFNIKAADFKKRVQGFYDKYGERAKKAQKNESIDWKAASHAMRGLLNYQHLLKNGDFFYPFTGEERELLLSIKLARISWSEFEKIFLSRLADAEAQKGLENKYAPHVARELILSFYDM